MNVYIFLNFDFCLTVPTVGVTYFQQILKYMFGFFPIIELMFSQNLSTPAKIVQRDALLLIYFSNLRSLAIID